MNRPLLRELSAFAAGLLFAAGLVVSGMTRPPKVLGFLDIFGAWDASLMFVMLGAIAVHLFAYRMIRGRSAPLFASKLVVPSRRDLDAKLLIGAAVFGAGWGLGGYCPGPGIVSVPGGGLGAAVFVLAMIAGMFATGKLEAALARDEQARAPRAQTVRSTPQPARSADASATGSRVSTVAEERAP